MSVESDRTTDLYNQSLIDHLKNFPETQRLKNPDATGFSISVICGSRVDIDLCLKDQKTTALGHEVQACTLTKAVLKIVLENSIGLSKTEISIAYNDFENWLSDQDRNTRPLWPAFNLLTPARSYTARHNSMVLPFLAVLEAFEKLDI